MNGIHPDDKLIAKGAAKIGIDVGIILGMGFVFFTSGHRHDHPGVLIIGLGYCLLHVAYTMVTVRLRRRRFGLGTVGRAR